MRYAFEVEQDGVTAAANAGPKEGVEGLITLCPDGSCVVYRGALEGIGMLFLKPLDRLTATPLPGTEHGHGAFFSPDGRWLAFFADDRLRMLPIEKPVVRDVASSPWGGSGCFGPDGRIYFASEVTGPISRVAADGGPVETVTKLAPEMNEASHRWPIVTPDGRTLIYESREASGRRRIFAQSLEDGRRAMLVEHGSHPRLAGGHLVFYDTESLKVALLDLRALRVIGPVVEALEAAPGDPVPTEWFDVSTNGTLAWYSLRNKSRAERQLWRVERSGQARLFSNLRRAFSYPRFSPDGRRLAVSIREIGGAGVWVLDVARQTLARLTPSNGSRAAIWSRDGRRLTYTSMRDGESNLYSEPADGSGRVERLTTSPLTQFPASWSRDDRTLSFVEIDPVTGADIRTVSPGEPGTRPLVNSPYGEWDGMLSPDGRLVAYASMESGRLEAYVRPVAGPGDKQQVSAEGGNSVMWARDGSELFYLNGLKMMAARIGKGPTLTVGLPVTLFEADYDFAGTVANYDVTPDGAGFVMCRLVRGDTSQSWAQGHVLVNWLADFERRTASSP